MNDATVARNFKDRLFIRLFGDKGNKQNLLSLFNALNGTAYTDENALQITTIEGVVYMGMKNDISCIIDNTMSLYEHQSSKNPNMPLRGFMYAGKLYDKYVSAQNLFLYGPLIIPLPTPQYYVFYNGSDEAEDRVELHLSDAFADSSVKNLYEWTAIMLNINYGHNRELMNKCQALEEYAKCIAVIRDHIKDSVNWQNAIKEAIDVCIREGILADFLKENKSEVVEMLLMEYDEQKVMEQLRRDYQTLGLMEGRAKGRAEGRAEGIETMQFVIRRLIEEKRLDDVDMLLKNSDMLDKFAKEFGFAKDPE